MNKNPSKFAGLEGFSCSNIDYICYGRGRHYTVTAVYSRQTSIMYKQGLYQDWKDGVITHNDYRHMNEDYERQNEDISEVITNLKKERDELENGIDVENPFLTTFRKYENIDKLAREILIELVDHIKVYEGGDISIRFKFADELRRIIEYIEVNSHL